VTRRGQVVALVALAAVPLSIVGYLALLTIALPSVRLGDERRAQGIALATAMALAEGQDPIRAVAAGERHAMALGLPGSRASIGVADGTVVVELGSSSIAKRLRILGIPLVIDRHTVVSAQPSTTQDDAPGSVLIVAANG
jgi:hypothetical protein